MVSRTRQAWPAGADPGPDRRGAPDRIWRGLPRAGTAQSAWP